MNSFYRHSLQKWRIFWYIYSYNMLSNISQKKQHAVKRIIVNQVEIPKRISNELKSKRFNNDNIKSYDDHSVQSNKEIARQLSNEYLQDCTVHGVKYLGNMQFKTNIFGKLFWATIMICSFLCEY